MKKNLVLSIIAVGMLFGMTACGESTPDEVSSGDDTTPASSSTVTYNEHKYTGSKEEVTLKVWAAAEEQSIVFAAADEYNAQEDSEYGLSITFGSVGEGDVANEMVKNVDEGADVYFCADDHITKLRAVNAMSTLVGDNLTWAKNNLDQYDNASFEGEIVAYTATISNLWFAYYDSDYLNAEEANSLETILTKAKEAGKKVYLPLSTGWYCLPSWFLGADIYYSTQSDGSLKYTTNLDDAQFATRLEYVNKLLAAAYKEGTIVIGQAMGGTEQSIFTLNGSWDFDKYKEKLPESLKATTTPKFKIGDNEYQMGSYKGSKLLGVNASHGALKQSLGHKLAQILLNKEYSLQRYEKRAMIPVNKEALADTRYIDHKTEAIIAIENQIKIDGFNQALTAQGSAVWDVSAAIGNALYGANEACDSATGLVSDWAAFLKTQADALRNSTI